MEQSKIIVVSAVNFVEGGPLTILHQCLEFLCDFLEEHASYKVIALVHDKKLCNYSHARLEYREMKHIKQSWLRRLKFEYWDCYFISRKLKPFLWLALHDISPWVCAERQVVYCHNLSAFHRMNWNEVRFSYKLFLFSCFYSFLYRFNIHRNNYIIVQQNWLREAFVKRYKVKKERVIVAYPHKNIDPILKNKGKFDKGKVVFFFPSLARPFKNFEVIGEAVKLLNTKELPSFEVRLTLSGNENKYSRWIRTKYGDVKNIVFCGLLSSEEMKKFYQETDCLIFPSKLETWGLPISEFAVYDKPVIAADLPYAYETAAGLAAVSFFNPGDAEGLAKRMEEILYNKFTHFGQCNNEPILPPFCQSWKETFLWLLEEDDVKC